MKLEDLQSLRFGSVGFDPELRAVFDAIPYTAVVEELRQASKNKRRKAIRYGKPLPGGTHVTIMGYSTIGLKSGVTGIPLDRALAKLISLGVVKTVKERVNIDSCLGTTPFYSIRQEDKVLGDHDYYLRLVEFPRGEEAEPQEQNK